MSDEKLARFEANIERLIESAFANFFGKRVSAQDIALELARAMQDNARAGRPDDARPVAPDHYRIELHPQLCATMTAQPGMQQQLSGHLVGLAAQLGYRLAHTPVVQWAEGDSLERGQIVVAAAHTDRPENSTAALGRVELPLGAAHQGDSAMRAQLLINGERAIPLGVEADILNVGRQHDNDVILDDPYVSRHHLQIRRRFGEHMLFDIHSQGGTLVNGVRVREHRLRSGDVIQVGRTHILYTQESYADDALAPTDSFEPLA